MKRGYYLLLMYAAVISGNMLFGAMNDNESSNNMFQQNNFQQHSAQVWLISEHNVEVSERRFKTALFLSTIKNTDDDAFNDKMFEYLGRLIDEGADVNARDVSHYLEIGEKAVRIKGTELTPLEMARQGGCKELEKFLVKRGAVDQSDEHKEEDQPKEIGDLGLSSFRKLFIDDHAPTALLQDSFDDNIEQRDIESSDDENEFGYYSDLDETETNTHHQVCHGLDDYEWRKKLEEEESDDEN